MTVRLTEAERAELEKRAAGDRRGLSDYIRIKLELPIEKKMVGKVDRRRRTA